MIVRFLKDYRSRAWMCRYGAGAVVEIDRADVVAEVLAGGYAVSVDVAPEPSASSKAAEAFEQAFADKDEDERA